MHMEKSTTVVQDFPIGCKDGVTRRRWATDICKTKQTRENSGGIGWNFVGFRVVKQFCWCWMCWVVSVGSFSYNTLWHCKYY